MARPELAVHVATMPQLAEAQCQDDDWTGLKDRIERRKRQNRLNVRAHRKRKLQQVDCPSEPQDYHSKSSLVSTHEILELPVTYSDRSLKLAASYQMSAIPAFMGPLPPVDFHPLSPNGNIKLPLSRDHLIPLIQYNVFRAILTNLSILSLTNHISPKRNPSPCPQPGPLFPAPKELPPSLAPTPLQQSTPHAVWIDMIPEGRMRDNAIRYGNTFDNESLCRDLIGGHHEGRNDLHLTGILVWNDPWCASGWEVTEGFVKKWGFLIKGCGEIMAATNRWREMRGDEPLVFEL